jgi:NADH-quinone oxidoreductase subunit N
LLATASKAAGVAGLLLLVQGPLLPLHARLADVLTVLAAGSLLAGNLGALGSTDAKRALALSGVSHAGFLLAALAAAVRFVGLSGNPGDGTTMLEAMTPALLLAYLLAYTLGTFATLGALAATPATDDAKRPLVGLRGLIGRDGSLSASLTLGIGSLAGIPPSAGFFAKLLVLIALVATGSWLLLGLAVVSVAVSIHYYFSIVREAVSRTEEPGEPLAIRWQDRLVPLVLGGATVALGLAILLGWAKGR